jgi:hypothetical protein
MMIKADASMLKLAKAAPLDLDSPQAVVAHQLVGSEFGASTGNRFTLGANDLQEFIAKVETKLGQFEEMVKNAKTPEDKARWTEAVEAGNEMLQWGQKAFDERRPIEADAHLVDWMVKIGMNPGSFKPQTKLPGPIPVAPRQP